MSSFDIGIVAVYLVALFGWAVFIGVRETADDFLVFSRRAPLLLVMFSLTSTWVGIGTTVATAASGYQTGISLGVTAAGGGVVGAMTAAWFAPRLKWFGDEFKAHTIGDFYLARYSRTARTLAGGFILLVYVLLTAAQFVGLGTLLRVWSGLEYELLVWFAALSTVVYTAFAGLKSDFYTDVVHFFVMTVVLLLVLLPLVLVNVDVTSGLATLPPSYLDAFAYGGPSFFVAGLVFGAGSMFITMEIWQRVYASASAVVARRALYLSVLVIVCFYLASSFFGVVTRIVVPNLSDPDQALFVLMMKYLPRGLLGFGVAAFMAVFVSTANSMLMVTSATLTKDFYKGIVRPEATDAQLLAAGRVTTLGGGLVAMAVALAFPNLIALAVNSLFMLLVLVPSVIGGFFWKRATATAASGSIVIGTLVLAALLPRMPETAFVPAFAGGLFTFWVLSMTTTHSDEENLSVVSGWRRAGPMPTTTTE